jgi:hypothetical protein
MVNLPYIALSVTEYNQSWRNVYTMTSMSHFIDTRLVDMYNVQPKKKKKTVSTPEKNWTVLTWFLK